MNEVTIKSQLGTHPTFVFLSTTMNRLVIRPSSILRACKPANRPVAGSPRVRVINITQRSAASQSHSPDVYTKEGLDDPNPPSSANAKVHQVDSSASSGASVASAQDAEPPSGKGKPEGYENASSEAPYKAPGPGERYGGMGGKPEEGTSKPNEGPEGAERGGRKPESR